MRIYLDVCCLQRPFDDQRQARIHLEAEAVKLLLARVEAGEFLWVSSEAVDDEVLQNPDAEHALKAMLLVTHAALKIAVEEKEIRRAAELERLGFTGFDALHLASAESGGVQVFLTTDDKILKRAARLATQLAVRVVNPLPWLQEIETL
ncbi:MAG: PIN domain-containing protein [Pyrinomonadaceae bacterium]|nr:PIN domain-containing protein [Pyrinomonadaceae bacterium]